MREHLSKGAKCLTGLLISWALLMWVRTFTGIANGQETSLFSGLLHSLVAIAITIVDTYAVFVFRYNPKFEDDLDDDFVIEEDSLLDDFLQEKSEPVKKETTTSKLQKSLYVVMMLSVIGFICVLSYDRGSLLRSMFTDSYVTIGPFVYDVPFLFDLLTVVVFPMWSAFIIREISLAGFKTEDVISGGLQILVLNCISFAMFKHFTLSYTGDLAIVSVVAVTFAVKTYAWKGVKKKGNVIAIVGGYVAFWGVLLYQLWYKGMDFISYLTPYSSSCYDLTMERGFLSNVIKIVKNAALIGQSDVLVRDPFVISFLSRENEVMTSTLFYGGWISAGLLLVVEIVFIVSGKVLIDKIETDDITGNVFYIAWVNLLIRVIVGTLYSFGMPIALLLPFSTPLGIIGDSMCMAIMVMGYFYSPIIKRMDDKYERLLEDDEEENYAEI